MPRPAGVVGGRTRRDESATGDAMVDADGRSERRARREVRELLETLLSRHPQSHDEGEPDEGGARSEGPTTPLGPTT